MAAITTGEILLKRSIKTGSRRQPSAQPDPNASLGRYVSTTAWAGGTANDLFDDVSGAENAASTVDYRCIFVHNSNTANALQNAVVYISAETAGGAIIALAADTTAASALAAAAARPRNPRRRDDPGAGVTGASPTPPRRRPPSGVALGTIGAGQVKAFWIRRTAANTAALSNDGVTITVSGDTGSL